MRVFEAAIALFFLFIAASMPVRADDFGPRRDIGQVRSDARRLLAHRVRVSGVDPNAVKIYDVIVVRDQAVLSWDSVKQHQVMGMNRTLDRWWDVPVSSLSQDLITAAVAHNAAVAHLQAARLKGSDEKPGSSPLPLSASGGTLWTPRQNTAGYDITITFATNDAATGTKFTRIYARAPTKAEALPNPPPPRSWGGPTDVGYFDLEIDGAKPVTFAPGTKVDVWFPFVLDDQLRYRISFVSADKIYAPIRGTIFDNVLHFELPAFTIAPGKAFQAEIEGWW